MMNKAIDESPPTLKFKRSGFFYPVISTSLTIVAGLAAILKKDNPTKFDLKDKIALTSMHYKDAIILPQELSSIASHLSLNYVRHALCMMLANLAFESAIAKNRNDSSPKWQLLRHIRNASSHNNRFVFTPEQPEYPAYWRKLAIDHTQKGGCNLLHTKVCFGSFMEIGELLWLLNDIESEL